MAEEAKDVKQEAKKVRRNAKAGLTRRGITLTAILDGKRPVEEVQEALALLQREYGNAEKRHEEYLALVEDDQEFETEEQWIEVCRERSLILTFRAKDYLRSITDKQPEVAQETTSASQQREPGSEQERAEVIVNQNVTENGTNETENTAVVPEPDQDQMSTSHVSSNNQTEDAVANVNRANDEEERVKACGFRVEKPKMPTFNGDIREYITFRADFKHIIESRYSERDSITMLRASLQGKPLDLIKGVGADYKAAWAYLDSIYGDPRFIADTITQDITKFKALQDGEDARFCELVHLVNRSYNTLKEVGRPHDMDNNHMLATIEQKMCNEDRKVWARDLEREKREATLESIMAWMTTEMKSRMRSSAPVRSQGQGRRWNVNHVNEVERFKCWVCKTSAHWVDQCPKVEAMTPAARFQLMKDNRACFSCLKKTSKNHKATACSRRRQCSVKVGNEQCKSYHHSLLHVPGNQCGIASVNNNTSVLLPLVEVEVLGQEGNRQRATVLLDSGAQISLIRQSVAKSMKLKGKDVMVTITKIGGEEEEIRTKLYKVRLLSLEDNAIQTVTAVGIPCISDNVEAVNVGQYAKELGLEERSLFRGSGPVDFLIGVDHPKIHTGETKEARNLVARHSPFGWVLFGAISRNQNRANRVLHVRLSSPIDMTDFWTTEAMGVSAKPCHCNLEKLSPIEQHEKRVIEDSCRKVGKQWMVSYPWKKDRNLLLDNHDQALKKLEATERRLKNNPANAEKYNEQFLEMAEKGFAKKLSDEELNNYKGPVHYIAHHEVLRPDKKSTPVRIVFNSSASYKGQRLNDFWMKGPDLLNSLFGVIMRFRENEVAFCGDISKMYHRILIPEEDQHVHRFLWRNLETERKPDVFVKRVLTFGDKPSPAMAQIALRKTAEVAKETHPDASRILLENSYVDNVCDSVPTVERAHQMTKEVDNVLASGGFNVKGWGSNRDLGDANSAQTSSSAVHENPEGIKLLESDAAEKVLGLIWDNFKDVFSFNSFSSGGFPRGE